MIRKEHEIIRSHELPCQLQELVMKGCYPSLFRALSLILPASKLNNCISVGPIDEKPINSSTLNFSFEKNQITQSDREDLDER